MGFFLCKVSYMVHILSHYICMHHETRGRRLEGKGRSPSFLGSYATKILLLEALLARAFASIFYSPKK